MQAPWLTTGLCNHNRIVFGGDVVLDSVNMAYRDEVQTLDQIHQKQIFLDFYYQDLKF